MSLLVAAMTGIYKACHARHFMRSSLSALTAGSTWWPACKESCKSKYGACLKHGVLVWIKVAVACFAKSDWPLELASC